MSYERKYDWKYLLERRFTKRTADIYGGLVETHTWQWMRSYASQVEGDEAMQRAIEREPERVFRVRKVRGRVKEQVVA
jgi:hypothetical protein